jgi:hypothetical protein
MADWERFVDELGRLITEEQSAKRCYLKSAQQRLFDTYDNIPSNKLNKLSKSSSSDKSAIYL